MAMCNGNRPTFRSPVQRRTLRSWRNGGKALDFYLRNHSYLPP